MNSDAEFNELCHREIVKIRELTLKDDEYTSGLLGEAVGSPVGITLCVEARMKQIADLQADNSTLRAQLAAQQSQMKLVHIQLGNMLFNLKQEAGMEQATRGLEAVMDSVGWDKH